MRGRSNDPVDMLVILTLLGVGSRFLWPGQSPWPESLPNPPAENKQPDQTQTTILPPSNDLANQSNQTETNVLPMPEQEPQPQPEAKPELVPTPEPDLPTPPPDLTEPNNTVTLDGQVNRAEAPSVLPAD